VHVSKKFTLLYRKNSHFLPKFVYAAEFFKSRVLLRFSKKITRHFVTKKFTLFRMTTCILNFEIVFVRIPHNHISTYQHLYAAEFFKSRVLICVSILYRKKFTRNFCNEEIHTLFRIPITACILNLSDTLSTNI